MLCSTVFVKTRFKTLIRSGSSSVAGLDLLRTNLKVMIVDVIKNMKPAKIYAVLRITAHLVASLLWLILIPSKINEFIKKLLFSLFIVTKTAATKLENMYKLAQE